MACHRFRKPTRVSTALLAAAGLLGCFSVPVNQPLERYDPRYGYRPMEAGAVGEFRDVGDAVIYVAFSGGGTRAAALAYGVLEGLRDTKIRSGGKPASVLDEVDTISGVSGGSFPAAYYGLFGDRIFQDFEPRFLKKNVEGALVLRALIPWNLVGLMTPWLSRSALASRYYDKHVFEHSTFADFRSGPGARIYVNATDVTMGTRFTFTQEQFDLLCSDLDPLPVGLATAASSAVPVVLSPITLRNHAGTCDYELPEWVNETLARGPMENLRGYEDARHLQSYQSPDRKKYVHLVDGGVADNLALRAGLDHIEEIGGIHSTAREMGLRLPRHLVFVIVNAATKPDPKIDLSSAAPSFAGLMAAVSGAQIIRYDIETLALLEESAANWTQELAQRGTPIEVHLVYVAFDRVKDPELRDRLENLPTSFVLKDEQVDELRQAGREVLESSPEFQSLVNALQ